MWMCLVIVCVRVVIVCVRVVMVSSPNHIDHHPNSPNHIHHHPFASTCAYSALLGTGFAHGGPVAPAAFNRARSLSDASAHLVTVKVQANELTLNPDPANKRHHKLQ